jgi:hypothetical protein
MSRTATKRAVAQRHRVPTTPPSLQARMAEMIEPEYMSVVDAEVLTGISRWYWRSLAYGGKVESVKLGSPKNGRLVIPISEVRRVMAEHTRPRVEAGLQNAVAR